mmetsp:Transcript_35468/g.113474  ORF Transcript_35468/g.113474 Transcript_35468/m.113474 type:complete len:488 (-) Transcript_35468:2439-3902(-)
MRPVPDAAPALARQRHRVAGRASLAPAGLLLGRRRGRRALHAAGRAQELRTHRVPRGGAAGRHQDEAQAVPGARPRLDARHGGPRQAAARAQRALLAGARVWRRPRLLPLLPRARRAAAGGAAPYVGRAALRGDGAGQDARGCVARRRVAAQPAARGGGWQGRVARHADHRSARAALAVAGRARKGDRLAVRAQARRGARAHCEGGGAREARCGAHDVPAAAPEQTAAGGGGVGARRARRDAGGSAGHLGAGGVVRGAARAAQVDGEWHAAQQLHRRPQGRAGVPPDHAVRRQPRGRLLGAQHRQAVQAAGGERARRSSRAPARAHDAPLKKRATRARQRCRAARLAAAERRSGGGAARELAAGCVRVPRGARDAAFAPEPRAPHDGRRPLEAGAHAQPEPRQQGLAAAQRGLPLDIADSGRRRLLVAAPGHQRHRTRAPAERERPARRHAAQRQRPRAARPRWFRRPDEADDARSGDPVPRQSGRR